MKWILFPGVALTSALTGNLWGQCAPQCASPPPCYVCPVPQTDESAPGEEGFFQRGPDVGEFAGESSSTGIKGLSIRFPEIRIDFPEIRLPHRVKYRRNAEMIADSSRAPFVNGQPLPFRQVPQQNDEAATGEETPQKCTPAPTCNPLVPGAAASRDKRLLNELARKDSEIEEMNRRFAHLETLVTRMAEAQFREQPAAPAIRQSSYERPAATSSQPATAIHRVDAASSASVHMRPLPETSRSQTTEASKDSNGSFGNWLPTANRSESLSSALGYQLRDPFQ